jgi:hypothetical protein
MKNLFITRDANGYKSHQAKIPTKSGKLFLSVVAGPGLYSSPKEYRKNCDYTEVEVAIFNAETNNWASFNEVKPVFSIIGMGEYYEGDNDNPQNAVFGHIDITLIPACIEVL